MLFVAKKNMFIYFQEKNTENKQSLYIPRRRALKIDSVYIFSGEEH